MGDNSYLEATHNFDRRKACIQPLQSLFEVEIRLEGPSVFLEHSPEISGLLDRQGTVESHLQDPAIQLMDHSQGVQGKSWLSSQMLNKTEGETSVGEEVEVGHCWSGSLVEVLAVFILGQPTRGRRSEEIGLS
jgi:hypothetical protein